LPARDQLKREPLELLLKRRDAALHEHSNGRVALRHRRQRCHAEGQYPDPHMSNESAASIHRQQPKQ
jgi:hypothetical protein